MGTPDIEKRIRWSGILICAGLLVQIATTRWTHPLSFMAFLVIGCPLMFAGAAIYLYSLVSKD